jgi:hypothetical protein
MSLINLRLTRDRCHSHAQAGGRGVGVRARVGRNSGATASPKPNRASHRVKRDRSAGICSGARGSTFSPDEGVLGWAESLGIGVCAMTYALQKVAPPTRAAGNDFKDGAVKSLAPTALLEWPGRLAQVSE